MLRVYLTGQVLIERGETLAREDALPGRQGRLLFARLALERQPVLRDSLADMLWPGRMPASWDRSITVLLSKLRRTLGPLLAVENPIATDLGGYRLVLPGDTWIDVHAAADAITRAEACLRASDLGGADGWAQVAWQIARRPFLAGDEGEWVEEVRERLRQIRLRALDCNAATDAAQGDVELSVQSAREALALDHLRESSLRQLMTTLSNAGRNAEALRAYDTFRRRLLEDIGSIPSPETLAVHRRIVGAG